MKMLMQPEFYRDRRVFYSEEREEFDAIDKCARLIQVLTDKLRYDRVVDRKHIISALADVLNTTEQLAYNIGWEDVEKERKEKLEIMANFMKELKKI